MKHGGVWLTLEITSSPPGYILLKGAFRAAGHLFPIEKKSRLLTDAHSKWDLTFVHDSPDKKAGLSVSIEAKLQYRSTRPGGKQYTVKFKNVDTYRMMKRLAQFNNLKLSWDPAIKRVGGITLNLKAKERVDLIHTVCKKYNLKCKVMGTVLWVKAK